MKDQTAIVGVGQTPFAKGLPQSVKQLALEAIVAALEDAGIDPSEVDGLSSYTLETTEEIEIASRQGGVAFGDALVDDGQRLRNREVVVERGDKRAREAARQRQAVRGMPW